MVTAALSADAINIVPQPATLKELPGTFVIHDQSKLTVAHDSLGAVARFFSGDLRRQALLRIPVRTGKKEKNGIHFSVDQSLSAEGYRISVDAKGMNVTGGSTKGLFYAVQSLRQLLPAFPAAADRVEIPNLLIEDAPRYPYRGYMLDVSRYFMPKDEVLRIIDQLAFHKINKFHWHLVDDNGWRIEIKKYPLLTSKGAFRSDRNQIFPLRSKTFPGEALPCGGFYTQEEIREVVAYAAERKIDVIPEIEMPAHTNSSLTAYPQLTCPVVEHQLETLCGIGGMNAAAIYCAGKEEVFTFLQDVIDEVCELFPSKLIHIGGDEAAKDNWEKCPLCQQRMKDNDIPNEEELQSYFIRRMNTYLQQKGRRLAGWDELVDSEIPADAVIYGWRGMGNSAAKAAKQGHQIVLTPARKFYLIRYQGPQWFEPYTYFGNNTLQDVYEYDPASSGIEAALQDRILGLQASLWTEFVDSPQHAQYLTFPRLAAFAENSWSTPENHDWESFLSRLDHLCEYYDADRVTYARSMFNLFHEMNPAEEGLEVSLSCIRPDVEIRYTTDGSAPNATSALYSGKVKVQPGSLFQAATFGGGERKGQVLLLSPVNHLAVGKSVTSGDRKITRLTNGLLGSERYTDGEYLDLYNSDDEWTVDLEQVETISAVRLSSLINAGMGVCYPANITVETSLDGNEYSDLASVDIEEAHRYPVGFYKNEIPVTGFAPAKARYVRIKAKNPGTIPMGHPREGQASRMVFDEILID